MHNGISWYAKVTMCFDVFFPEGDVNCRHCDFCQYNENFATYRCRLTGETLYRAELNNRGRACPAILDKTTF